MKEKISQLESQFNQDVVECKSLDSLQKVKAKYLGKSGALTELLRSIKDVEPSLRPMVGGMINALRVTLEERIEHCQQYLYTMQLSQKLAKERIDISMTGHEGAGSLHPITLVINEICDLLSGLGFEIGQGPEIESDYYNFQALNIPAEHPSRDMQDTFYINDNVVLRTQTSAVQARMMQDNQPPIKLLCPGKVFRSDSDASHSPVFYQIEGLVVDENITLCDLKGTLEYLAKNLFDQSTKVRFRPSYFPFTEPSVEVDLTCSNCGGVGCSLCKGTGWIEVLGAGMVHPYVLENCNIDSNKYQGFAFGMGVERIAMIKYGIPNIKLFYDNDVRFLKQFKNR